MGLTVDTRVIKKFKHRVQVCSAEDVVVNGKLEFRQKFIYDGWAMINPRRTQTFSMEGQTVFEEKDRRTHFIHMRYNPNVLLTTSAWIYEARLKSPPRWFKILFSGDEYEDSRYFKFDCRLMSTGDDILEPQNDQKFVGIPEGFKL
jgi:hypothetical protein